MRLLLYTFLLTVTLLSCNSSEKTETAVEETTATTSAADSTAQMEKRFIPITTDEALIATALMAAPEASRARSKVIGYNMKGEFVTLREGDNEFIVIADNPNQKGFNAACYHKSLEPFMARGRALKAEGKKGQEIFDIREEEMKSGKLNINAGSTLHVYYGPDALYNPENSSVKDAKLRYVVYLPWSTSESTGLPESPVASNHPWIMNPGTHRAHIMISPLSETE